MTPPSMETLLFLLSGVVAFAGVIFWLWSNLQLTQKKVQLLENAVFELREMISVGQQRSPPPVSHSATQSPSPPPPPPSPSLLPQQQVPAVVPAAVPEEEAAVATPIPATFAADWPVAEAETSDPLQPGGRLSVGGPSTAGEVTVGGSATTTGEVEELSHIDASLKELKELKEKEKEKETASVTSQPAQSLEGMRIQELRRLAEQRGITGVADVRKKELIAMIRAAAAFNVPEPIAAAPAGADEEVPTPAAAPAAE